MMKLVEDALACLTDSPDTFPVAEICKPCYRTLWEATASTGRYSAQLHSGRANFIPAGIAVVWRDHD